MKLFYKIYISLLQIAIGIASPFNSKAKKWKNGRTNWESKLSEKISRKKPDKLAWFHVSSLGEYEQAIPLISKIKKLNYTIAVSFFSSSGYDHVSDSLIDIKFYLPLDKKRNAITLVDTLKPNIVFWIKNDFWIHTIEHINDRKIPLFFVSLLFNKDSFFLNRGFSLIENSLAKANHIFVQNHESEQLLKTHNINHISVVGDTRVTRVIQRKKKIKSYPTIQAFKGNKKMIFYASVHKEDLRIITNTIEDHSDFKHVIIPHEIDDQSINRLLKEVDIEYTFYDDLQPEETKNLLIVNKIGLLFDLYQYANLVYIGGGFGKGIHNILEPTVFGIPVAFGPNYEKFEEAKNFIHLDLCYSILEYKTFKKIIAELDSEKRKNIAVGLQNFYTKHHDASQLILEYCLSKNLVY